MARITLPFLAFPLLYIKPKPLYGLILLRAGLPSIAPQVTTIALLPKNVPRPLRILTIAATMSRSIAARALALLLLGAAFSSGVLSAPTLPPLSSSPKLLTEVQTVHSRSSTEQGSLSGLQHDHPVEHANLVPRSSEVRILCLFSWFDSHMTYLFERFHFLDKFRNHTWFCSSAQ
ncbi:hypothetical protein C8R42DRAFT_415052 [Lentinula raphanica]|nr:hypothetical protein C8R42DRAFT_415052 [Lentinula raphanica]